MEITPARQWALKQIIFKDALEEIDGHFKKLQIPYMPVKGAHLICTGMAEKMKERIIRDIDLMVEEEYMREVSDYFVNLENTELKIYHTENYRPTETALIYYFGHAVMHLEIHCQLNIAERFLLPTKVLFDRATAVDTYRRIPSPEDALLIFLCHLQTHIPFEFRSSTFDEIDLLSSHAHFNWDVFWQHCPATGIESFIYFILRVFSKRRPIPLKPSRHYRYAELLAGRFTVAWYETLQGWARRLLFDLPFVRQPGRLMLYKLLHALKR